MLVVRTEKPITEEMKKKIALFTDVPENAVIESRDAKTLYSIPLALQAQKMDQIVVDHFGFNVPPADMTDWTKLEHKVQHLTHQTKIALVGKYVALKMPISLLPKHLSMLVTTGIPISTCKCFRLKTLMMTM